MRHAAFAVACIVGLIVLMWTFGKGPPTPEIFADTPYEDARQRADAEDRLLVTYFTASWCPPCRQMKSSTWVDRELVEWMEQHAVVAAVDVDAHPGVAQANGVQAMPTIVVFRNGEEVSRIVGFKTADALLAAVRPLRETG